jgi:tRNA(Ile)-lysidine synthase
VQHLRLVGPDPDPDADPEAAGDLAGAAPLDDAALAARMAALGPFEPAPHLAVAVSGGPDSLALTLLLDRWARARGGAVLALTVDHGLRAEAADEAAWVADRLGARGIAHETLTWRPAAAHAAAQDTARSARYSRLVARCAEAGILHLAFAHHRADQAETLLLRIAAGTGPDGMSAMAWQRELPDLRVLRPLLDVPAARLRATLRGFGQPWIADPSNDDPHHERVRVRRTLPDLAAEGLTVDRLAATAGALGRARQELDTARADLAARAVRLHPAGFAAVDLDQLLGARAPLGADVLARVLRCVGGRDQLPRRERLSRLVDMLRARPDRPQTLGGCEIRPWAGTWLILREPGRAPSLALAPGETGLYDGRYQVRLGAAAPGGCRVAPLEREGWAALTARTPALRESAIPPPVRPALPALWDAAGPRVVPAVNWQRDPGVSVPCELAFAPRRALGEAGFAVAPGYRQII